jgi:hypothetical protein
MAQQVGRGAAPAAQETEALPGGASGMTQADPSQNGTRVSLAGEDRPGRVRGWLRRHPQGAVRVTETRAPNVPAAGPELDLASNDPLVGYLLSAASAVDISRLQLQSPALEALRQAGVVLVVPLISSGSLVGGGIGMLVTLLVRANRQHQALAAYGLSEHYREIFELTRLDEAITIYDNEESALDGGVR